MLKEHFPFGYILEEVTLPGTGGLTADFFLPQKKLIVEVHGPQHYKYNTFFHRDISAMIAQRQNDRRKREFCELNEIDLVELPYNRIEEWQKILLNR